MTHAMKTQDPSDVLKEILEIVDMFEDENNSIAGDTILLNPALNPCRTTGDARLDAERAEKLTAEMFIHTGMLHAARQIGVAIRERFGLPVKDVP